MAEIPEYLKIATTALVIEMIEARFVGDAPQLKNPIDALHLLAHDSSLKARVELKNGTMMSALELQHWYLAAAKRYLSSQSTVALEQQRVIELWGDMLSQLALRPDSLIGRLDWVTKRCLLARCSSMSSGELRKKIDLRYHELGRGYYARLARAKLVPKLLEDHVIQIATRRPPSVARARRRGRWIRHIAAHSSGGLVSWEEVRLSNVDSTVGGKVIHLDLPSRFTP